MHPYRMQVLIKQRGKDLVANVAQRNSIYQTIDALRRAGLIAIRETTRDERRPERTVYEVTDEGRRTLVAWLRAVLSTPAREFPDFPAGLSLAAGLTPDDVRTQLEARTVAKEAELRELEKPYPDLPRLFLLESEYLAAVTRAEVKWLRAVTADLHSKKLTWSHAMLRRMAAAFAQGDAEKTGSVDRGRADRADEKRGAKRTRRASSKG